MLRENLTRLKIENVFTVQSDGSKFKSGVYDRVLIDAPCSGTGVFRKFPEGRWITTPKDVERFSVLQLALLENAISLLAEDGYLVYSTCSIMRQENEHVIDKLLANHSELEVAVPPCFAHTDLIGEDKFLRTYPGLKYFDNLFAACLKRK